MMNRLVTYLQENQRGIVHDLLFAMIWVGIVSLLFAVVDGPQWAYYLCMLAGIPAYFGYVYSWEMARQHRPKTSRMR